MAEKISLKYEGDAVASGEMDASAVGNSIVAFGELVRLTVRTAYDVPDAEVQTTVRGLHGGSFIIDYGVVIGAAGLFADTLDRGNNGLRIRSRDVEKADVDFAVAVRPFPGPAGESVFSVSLAQDN